MKNIPQILIDRDNDSVLVPVTLELFGKALADQLTYSTLHPQSSYSDYLEATEKGIMQGFRSLVETIVENYVLGNAEYLESLEAA